MALFKSIEIDFDHHGMESGRDWSVIPGTGRDQDGIAVKCSALQCCAVKNTKLIENV
jgi:hypothetical protein